MRRVVRDRTGIVLYLVLGVLATVGSILFLLHASFTQWERRLHVDTDEVVARHLARGALEALAFAMEAELDVREGRSRHDVVRGRLGEVLCGDERTLARALEHGGGADGARALIAQLVGPEVFGTIGELAKPWTGAEFSWRISLKPQVAGPVTALADAVVKNVTLHVECTCHLNHARRVAEADLGFTVGSILPGVLGRFTLAWTPGTTVDGLTVDQSGASLTSTKPLVCFNDPSEYSPTDPLWSGKTEKPRALKAPGFSKIDELEKALSGRGAVFLSGESKASPLVMQVAAGSGPAGQGFQLFTSAGAKPFVPERQSIASAPSRIRSMHPSQPGTSVRQEAWIEGVVTGFYSGVNARGQQGGDVSTEASSFVRPLGTSAHPSAGLVYGHARARLAAVSNLAVDRDQTSKDEGQQLKSVGFALPVPEVREPPLRNVTAASFAAEIARERANTPLQELFFFGSEMLGPGLAQNGNLIATSESGGGGVVDCERPFPRITLLRLFYKYGRMFETYAEYEAVMSRKLELAYNGLLRYPSMDPAAAEAELMKLAFARTSPPDDRDMLSSARMEHTDSLHQQLSSTLFVDSARAAVPETALGALVSATSAGPRMVRTGVTCHGLELFRASFLTGTTLDLDGWWVSLAGATAADPPPALELENVSVGPLGGGVLEVASLALSGLTNTGTGVQLQPLVVKVGTLKLKGLGPYEGTFIVNDRLEVVPGVEGHAVIRGNLVLAPGATLDLKGALAVVRAPALDPTAEGAHAYYHGRLDTVWSGKLVSGVDLIGANAFRTAGPP